MQSLNATRQAANQYSILARVDTHLNWPANTRQRDRYIYIYVCYIETEARGHAQWRWLLPSCGYGGLSCLAMRNNNYKWSDVNFSWQYLLFTLSSALLQIPPLPSPSFPLPIERYRSVLSLNKWNLLLTVSDPNYTYRLFISIHTHMQTSIKSIATWQSDAV